MTPDPAFPQTLVAPEGARRLDRFLAAALADHGVSRTLVQRAIQTGAVLVNGQPATAAQSVDAGAVVTIAALPQVEGAVLRPEAIPLDVVYEDDELVVINKPRGLVVHPATGNPSGTLVNGLLHRYGQLEDPGLASSDADLRPGIVHRLDKDTTGLMVVARTARAGMGLRRQIAAREVKRTYLAVVRGHPAARFTVDAAIGRTPNHLSMTVTPKGRTARTHAALRTAFPGQPPYSLLECNLETGRTHQIRVHLAFAGFPVACDPLYGSQAMDRAAGLDVPGQLLHAFALAFRHPVDGRDLSFEQPVPDDFAAVVSFLSART